MVPQSAEIRADSHTNWSKLISNITWFCITVENTNCITHREKMKIFFSLHLAIRALQTISPVIILKSVLKISFKP